MATTGQAESTDAGAVCASQRCSPRSLTDGERWTAEALAELRRRHHRPSAWLAFLRSSLGRSSEGRRARQGMARQASRWGVIGAVAWVAACTAAGGRHDLRPRPVPGLLWWFAVWRMLDWHLGMAEGGDGRPRERLSPADAITLVRFWLVPGAFAVARSSPGLPILIIVGGLTDRLDGDLARRHGRTRLGRDLDTTADLAFLTASSSAARAAGRIPPLAFWALAARHGLGLAIALGAAFGRARRPAIRGRPWGALLRIGGLAICTSGADRTGGALVIAGCLVPPRWSAPHLSRA